MEFFDVVNGRHSYRGPYTDAPVPGADLVKIVEAGINAPSAVNWQTTTFVIVNGPEVLSKIAALAPDVKGLNTCPALIAVVADGPEESPRPGLFFGVQDYAAATENMLLAITALGYASVWTEGMLARNDNWRAVGELLGVPSPKRVRVLLPVGVPAEPLVARGRKPFAERAHWNHWAR
jgi:nitroreductase